MRLVLASASPRRAELLRAAGFQFEMLAVDVDEGVRPGEPPESYVRRLAEEKSALALSRLSGTHPAEAGSHVRAETGSHVRAEAGSHVQDVIVLGADTAVVIDGEILGKPRDDRDAETMLRRLSGRRHEVMTGVSVRSPVAERSRVATTAVYFSALGADDIAWYLESGEGRDKAGGYAIQGLASRFIPRVEGSYSNVVGLPVASVVELVKEISGTRPGR